MMSNRSDRKIATNYIYNLIYQIVAMIIPLVTTPYVSRVLDAEGVGEYSFAFSCVSIFIIIGNFGFATYGQLTIASSRKDKNLLSKNLCGIFLSRSFLMMASTAMYYAYMLITGSLSTLYYILFLHLLASALDISWFFQGVEDFKTIAIVNSLTKLLGTAFVFLFVKTKSDVGLYALIIALALLSGNAIYLLFLKKYEVKFTLEDIGFKAHLKASIIYFIPTIATSVYTVIDKSMIGWITSSDYENGIYEQAQKIVHMSTTVVTSISMVIMPRMASLFHDNEFDEIKSIFLRYSSFILMLAFPLAFGLSAISERLVFLYLGPRFEQCKGLLVIMSPLIILIGLDNAIGQQILIATRKQKQYNLGVVIGSITNFILNLILIHLLSARGAAIASVISESVILVVFIIHSNKFINYKRMLRNCWKYLLASVGMIMGVLAANHVLIISWMSIVTEIIAAALLYFLLLIVLKEDNIKQIICTLRKKK